METTAPDLPDPRTRREIRADYDRLVTRHRTPLLAFLTRYLADTAAAADVAQEAFVRAYFQLDRYEEGRPFGPWLFTIAGNLARDHLRRAARQRRHLAEAAPLLAPAGSTEKAGDALDRAIAALPDGLREPILLHYQLDWSLAAIAAHLGVREGAVKTRLHRAREILRAQLAPAREDLR